jgi:hypothetical protein
LQRSAPSLGIFQYHFIRSKEIPLFSLFFHPSFFPSCSLITIHCSFHLLFVLHCSPLCFGCSSPTHCCQFFLLLRCSFFVHHPSFCVVHSSSFCIVRSSFMLRPSVFVLRCSWLFVFVLRSLSPFVLVFLIFLQSFVVPLRIFIRCSSFMVLDAAFAVFVLRSSFRRPAFFVFVIRLFFASSFFVRQSATVVVDSASFFSPRGSSVAPVLSSVTYSSLTSRTCDGTLVPHIPVTVMVP